MERQVIVTEGEFDKALLEKVLPREVLDQTTIVERVGSSSALSLARTYYLKGWRVLYVVDAKTLDGPSIQEKKQMVEAMLKMVGSGEGMKVVVGVPGLEALLFTDREFVEGYFSKSVTEKEMQWFRKVPSFAIEQLANGSFNGDHNGVKLGMLAKMGQGTALEIRKEPVIEEIVSFLA